LQYEEKNCDNRQVSHSATSEIELENLFKVWNN